ncbi:MAG: V-type ATP synthase subunit E [Phycisphaerales bacterium]|nr:MAG: V-type ATP synthase subunit E [Phycisphaerales bacterium]
MEAEQVIEKILSDARAEAGKIAAEARQREDAEQSELDKKLEEYKSQTSELVTQKAADEKAHILAAARMEIAKALLAEKRAVLDEIFDQARNKLGSLSDDDYRALMTKLMLQAAETGEEEVLIDKGDKRINRELIAEVNRGFTPAGKGALKLSEEKLAIQGGFILRRGKVKTNVSFGVLLDQARKEMEIKLAKEMFS